MTTDTFVSNHGKCRETQPVEGEVRGPDSLTRTSLGYNVPGRVVPLVPSTGQFLGPSITVHSRTATGNAAPLRIIHGPHTQLSLPDGIYRDPVSGELIVANTGDDSVLFFAKDAAGDAKQVRVLKGWATKLKGPVRILIDSIRHKSWLVIWNSHGTAAL